MKNLIKNMITGEKNFALHLPLVSLLYLLSNYRAIHETDYPITSTEFILTIVLVMLLTAISFILIRLLIKNNIKAAIAATFFLAFGFNFFSLSNYLLGYNLFPVIAANYFGGDLLIASSVLLVLALTVIYLIVSKIKTTLVRFNGYLNILLMVFICFELINFFTFEPKRIELEEKISANITPVESSALPDIYYIIFDSYTSFESLKRYWDYDNAKLGEFLKKRKFFIARDSHSNYNQTHFTMASNFNMSYLDYDSFSSLTIEHYPNLFRLIKDNTLIKTLERAGYKTINLSLFDIAGTSKFYRFDVIDEPGFFRSSLFKKIIDVDYLAALLGLTYTSEIRGSSVTEEIFSELKTITKKNYDKPVFVYAHIMIPHPPYFFDKEGNLMPFDYANESADKWKYLNQLKYTNSVLMDAVENIFANAEREPVIIIQGDHGFRMLEDKKQQGAESHSILNTIYFPDHDYSLLYNNISSVNTFRVLLMKLGLMEIELKPDKKFFVAEGIGF